MIAQIDVRAGTDIYKYLQFHHYNGAVEAYAVDSIDRGRHDLYSAADT
jgi:hypothetical protein